MARFLRSWLPLAVITLFGLWLRIHDLAARPMHADEANQAVKFGELLETGRYAFDPGDHHGPTLYYASLPVAWLRGEHSLADLTETTVRLVPALFGTLSIVLLFLLFPSVVSPAGDAPSPRFPLAPLAAAAFLAVAPPAVYYSRDFIQETLLGAFVLGSFVAAQRWWRAGGLGWAILAGIAAGLAQATKASAPLFLVAGVGAALVAGCSRPVSSRLARGLPLALIAALGTAVLFYSSFGTHLAGLRDAVGTYSSATHRIADAGAHVKPWWYYLRLFAWQTDGGLSFNQLAFTALAACGLGLAFVLRDSLLRWAAVYTTLVVLALSLTPYKTPWHAIHFVPGFALLAGGALGAFPRRTVAWLLLAVVLVSQLLQTRLTSFQRPADTRNPYAYVHSAPDVKKFRALADAALARQPDGVVRVISEEYWPLPWYFRGLPRVGYWSTPPADCDAALIVASGDLAAAVRQRLHGSYRETFVGLRPGFVCIIFTPDR